MVNQGEDEDTKKAFDDVRGFYLPAIPDLPPEKSREEILLEQKQEQGQIINAQKKQFPVISCISTDTFLDRGEIGEVESSSGSQSTAFKEDVESYRPTSKSSFERLHAPRRFVLMTKQFRQSFERNSVLLNRSMDDHDVPRVPNAMKRIKKGEEVNLYLPRYSAQQVKQLIGNGKDDLFNYLTLLPLTLTKSSKSNYQRRMKVLHKFQEMLQDCDYSNRPGFQERKQLKDIQKKISELQIFIDTPRPQNQNRSASVPAKKIQPSAAPVPLKRNDNTNYSSDTEPVIPRKITQKEPRPSTSSTENRETIADARLIPGRSSDSCSSEDLVPGKIPKVQRNVDPNVERERIRREQRKQATLQREAEHLENQRREKEEHARRQAAEREEAERRRVEFERRKAVQLEEDRRREEERKRQLIRIAEEYRVSQEREQERLKLQEEERTRRKNAEELEKLKLLLQERPREAPMIPKPRECSAWRFLPIRMPPNRAERKAKYFNHYKWSADPAQRERERLQAPLAVPGHPILIPHANNAQTKVTPLTMPKVSLASKSSSALTGGTFKKPGPVVPVYRKGDQKDLEKLIEEIKKLNAFGRKSIANHVSLTTNEVNYQDYYLHILRHNFTYPFGISDGFYWPMFFVVDDKSIHRHVRYLAVCNSFSGKYASRYLLTTPLQEDSASKKFDASYHDCGGDWAQYSQKPGRFSKRLGYRAHYSKSKDSFDVQKQRARDKLRNDYDNERREQDEFGRYMDEYKRHGGGHRNNEYRTHITTHLRQLVKDARLDIYSVKEKDHLSHPGTRHTPVPHYWHTHGYNLWLRNRDQLYGEFMHKACDRYESLLKPRTSANVDQFNEWCFTPMIASLHYQSKYSPFDVFCSRETKELNERYRRYHGLLRERKFPLKEAIRVCKLTTLDKKQWTILHEQLVSHFRDFPTVFHLMYNKQMDLITKVDNIVVKLMDTKFSDRENDWNNSARQKIIRRYR